MLERFTNFFESDFFPRMRELTGQTTADSDTMYKVIDYIDWAIKNKQKLLIPLTDEDRRLVRLVDEAESNYEDIAAQPDETFIPTWEVQQFYIEMSQVVRGELALADARVLTKYFPQASVENAPLPKFIFLSGHGTNVEALLWLFGEMPIANPPESSSVWVNYYEDVYAYTEEGRYQIEVVYCPNNEDFNECRTLEYDKFTQKGASFNSAANFEHWI